MVLAEKAAEIGLINGCIADDQLDAHVQALAEKLKGDPGISLHVLEHFAHVAHGNALAAQSLLPDVQRAQERFARLAADERGSGQT